MYSLRCNHVVSLSNCQISTKAITSSNTASKTVLVCKNTINNYSRHDRVRIIWVPSHHEVIGNVEPNVLANRARVLNIASLDNPLYFSALKTKLRKCAETSHRVLLNNRPQ